MPPAKPNGKQKTESTSTPEPQDGVFGAICMYVELRPSYEARLGLPHFKSRIGGDTNLVMDTYASPM